MEKTVLTVLLVLFTVGIIIFAYLIYNTIIIAENTKSLYSYTTGISVLFVFFVYFELFNYKEKEIINFS
jgi:hypothetical protein